MIRTETEYRDSLKRIERSEEKFREEEARLAAKGLNGEQIKRLLDPSRVFHAQIKSEVQMYERLKQGKFDHLHSLQDLGQLLISLRIASGLSQRDLADRLGVHESQVSRDERNEFSGITVDRANRIIEALGAQIATQVVKPPVMAKSA